MVLPYIVKDEQRSEELAKHVRWKKAALEVGASVPGAGRTEEAEATVLLRAYESWIWDFPDGPVVKNLPASAGDVGLIPGLRRSHVLQGN